MPSTTVVVRLRRSMARNVVVSFVLVNVVIYSAVYYLSVDNGSWRTILLSQLLFLLLGAWALIGYRMTFMQVSDSSISRRILTTPLRHWTPSDVSRIIIVDTFRTSTLETLPQMLALDADGNRLFRMSGRFWSETAMFEVANAIGAPVTRQTAALSSREFFASYPTSAYWFEGRIRVYIVAAVVAVVVGFLVVCGLMSVLGIPLAFIPKSRG